MYISVSISSQLLDSIMSINLIVHNINSDWHISHHSNCPHIICKWPWRSQKARCYSQVFWLMGKFESYKLTVNAIPCDFVRHGIFAQIWAWESHDYNCTYWLERKIAQAANASAMQDGSAMHEDPNLYSGVLYRLSHIPSLSLRNV